MRHIYRPILGVLTAALLGAGAFAVGAESTSSSDDGGVGPEVCADCHAEYVEDFMRGRHSVLDSEGLADRVGASSSCEACHGDPTEHLEAAAAGTIFAFAEDDPVLEKVERCQSCHASEHPRFQASAHARAGMACNDCHPSHDQTADWNLKGNRQVEPLYADRTMGDYTSDTLACSGCHQEVFTEFEFNERHRLQEGILECTSCHNPHEPQARMMLAGFKQQSCTECHADKEGPFVFEHGAGRVEGCASCHAVHGSPNRHMLHFQNVAEQCYSCHVLIPGFHARFTAESQCTNCHSTIHGSNFDKFFLK